MLLYGTSLSYVPTRTQAGPVSFKNALFLNVQIFGMQYFPENTDEREEIDVSLISCAMTRRAAGASGVARTEGRC